MHLIQMMTSLGDTIEGEVRPELFVEVVVDGEGVAEQIGKARGVILSIIFDLFTLYDMTSLTI